MNRWVRYLITYLKGGSWTWIGHKVAGSWVVARSSFPMGRDRQISWNDLFLIVH